MFNGVQLRAWMENFYGYGNPEGPYWLVGMEEGGGGSEADVQARLDTWTPWVRHHLPISRHFMSIPL